METQEKKLLELELKYCERCGTLWLRILGSEVVVCAACARALAGLHGWPGVDHSSMDSAGAVATPSAFWVEGGNA